MLAYVRLFTSTSENPHLLPPLWPPRPPRVPRRPPRDLPPLAPPLVGADVVSRFLVLATFGTSSSNNVSRANASGSITYLMLLPLIESCSIWIGVAPRNGVIFTDFRCVFMDTSTPAMVPCTMVPFFNSIVTVSWLNFIRNLHKTPIV